MEMLRARLYRSLLCCYPSCFRAEYGAEMLSMFNEQLRDARRRGGRRAELSVWLQTIGDVLLIAPQEHCHVIAQDLRYAFRALASQPVFAAVAIMSLALGIGANTALFSVLYSVSMAALPVPDPQSLVMLTNPGVRGVSVGSQSNERALLTYPEFQQIRDESNVFSALMACQSQLERLPARVNGGEPAEIRTRMVSAGYFDTLQVTAVLGRTFRAGDDRAAQNAVVSYAYWQNRFGGRADVLGSRIRIGKGVFTVIGVTPSSFFGETVGERPDVWLPLTLQPLVLPGRDWLRDVPGRVEKVMWLHVFGRLKPGVTLERAQTAANTVFRQGLAAYYESIATPEARKEFLNQSLKLRSAAMGASEVRGQFAQPLTVILVAAGLVLLIACANLSNLLLARATARTKEVAVRLALGAARAQLARQLLTETLVLAAAGGAVGLAAATAMRRLLLRIASGTIYVPPMLDAHVLGFAFALTMAAGLVLGILPLLRTLSTTPGVGLQTRAHAAGASGWVRTGRFVVMAQLALSVPLVFGSVLLVKTLHNLRQVDLGYVKERLLIVEVDAETAGYKPETRPALFERLLERIRAVPGVVAVTYSNNGLFSGSDSGDQVAVEGYRAKGRNDRGSRYDHVGPKYFSTLGIPLLMGREITDRDQLSTERVCVINEAFARQFFAGKNPLGLHVTQIYGNERNTCSVAGVVRNSRANNLRGDIEHRFYVPAAQPVFALDAARFAIRTAADPSGVIGGVRRAILSEDASLPVTAARPLEAMVNERIAQDRLLAQLSTAFGAAALLLAGLGLYGILAYSVARRTNELGIRKALGARQGTLVGMILRETALLLAAGLVLGAMLSMAGVRLIASRLYGLTPGDPIALASTIALLAVLGLAAAWIPAARAAYVDPLVALRYE